MVMTSCLLQGLIFEREGHMLTLRCLANSLPWSSKMQQVLYSLPLLLSGIDPATNVTPFSLADADISDTDADDPASMSSAYFGKLSLEYGQFHISGRTTSFAPACAASCSYKVDAHWHKFPAFHQDLC